MNKWIFIFLIIISVTTTHAQDKVELTVYFRFDKHDLESIERIKIKNAIQDKIIQKIQLEAHCDSFGSNAYNDLLSIKRADEIKDYLISLQLNDSLIDIKTFGKRNPLQSSEYIPALNRRAQIAIYSVKPETSSDLRNQSISKPVTDSIKSDAALNLEIDSAQIRKFEADIEKAEVGSTIRLGNLNFVGGMHRLLPQSKKTLELLLKTMKENPTLEIQIQGHICCARGGEDGMDYETGTMNLSYNRAKAIYDYLVKNGISSSRLSYKGFGSRYKLVMEKTETDRSINRRVEIKIVRK